MNIHWTKLKKMVEDAGGVWTNREDAEAFLAGQGVVVEAAPVAPKAAAMLDRALPYGTVIGELEGMPSARYAQGGKYFNAQGEQVG